MIRKKTSKLKNLIYKYCGKSFFVSASLYRQSVQRKVARRFCSRSCSAVAKSMGSVKTKFNQWADFEEKLRKALLAHRPDV